MVKFPLTMLTAGETSLKKGEKWKKPARHEIVNLENGGASAP
jgi:hypothetical protein